VLENRAVDGRHGLSCGDDGSHNACEGILSVKSHIYSGTHGRLTFHQIVVLRDLFRCAASLDRRKECYEEAFRERPDVRLREASNTRQKVSICHDEKFEDVP
jgi:hypothetical protein